MSKEVTIPVQSKQIPVKKSNVYTISTKSLIAAISPLIPLDRTLNDTI